MIQTWIIFRMNPFSKGTFQLHGSWTHLPKQSSWWLRSVAEPSHSAKDICFQVMTTIAPKANRECAYVSTIYKYMIYKHFCSQSACRGTLSVHALLILPHFLDYLGPLSIIRASTYAKKNARYTSSIPSIHYTRPSPLSRFLIFLMAFGGLEIVLSWSLFLR